MPRTRETYTGPLISFIICIRRCIRITHKWNLSFSPVSCVTRIMRDVYLLQAKHTVCSQTGTVAPPPAVIGTPQARTSFSLTAHVYIIFPQCVAVTESGSAAVSEVSAPWWRHRFFCMNNQGVGLHGFFWLVKVAWSDDNTNISKL